MGWTGITHTSAGHKNAPGLRIASRNAHFFAQDLVTLKNLGAVLPRTAPSFFIVQPVVLHRKLRDCCIEVSAHFECDILDIFYYCGRLSAEMLFDRRNNVANMERE